MAIYLEQSDNVDFKHPEYVQYSTPVGLVNDIFNGIDTAVNHLTQVNKESQASYDLRKDNATLKNYVKRATEAFVGMIYRKPVQLTGFSDRIVEIGNKIDTKSTINKFAREVTAALVRDGKVFITVDAPIGGGKPYTSLIHRANVINWRKDNNGKYIMLVLVETVEEEYGDFGLEVIQQWRVYKNDGNVDIYRKKEDGDFYVYESIDTDFDYIPIIDIELSEIPPLYDIAKLTIKHMNRTSLKDKYLDMCSSPIPLIWSLPDDDGGDVTAQDAYVIGVDQAFVFSGTKDEADFQWRELSGSSMTILQDDLSVIEDDITSGVIRAASSDTTTIKTATQSFYEAAESSNRVTVIANAVEIGLNDMMQMVADIINEETDDLSRVIVNKDFNAILQGNDSLRLLWEVYMGGAMSIQTFLKSLESFEVVDIGSVEDEILRIEKDTFKPESKVSNNSKESDLLTENMDNRTIAATKVE